MIDTAPNNPVASAKPVYWRGKQKRWSRVALTTGTVGTEDQTFGTGQSLSPKPPAYISGVSLNKRSTAMITATEFPDERDHCTFSPPWYLTPNQPRKLSHHDQAECDYLESLFSLDAVEGSDNE